MDKAENIEEFYKAKNYLPPESRGNEFGQFNVFKLESCTGGKAKPVPYRRRDFYKISLIIGNNKVHYADKVIEVKKQALVFSNPQIPYSWEQIGKNRSGYFCIFNNSFINQNGILSQYMVFQPGGTHVFELDNEQVEKVKSIYERMFNEINSEYKHKYDLLRIIVLELIHFGLKMQPASNLDSGKLNATKRISSLFAELLERQFPIDDVNQVLKLRSASDYANRLNIHVNHLNRALKAITRKTTSRVIAERILQESKILLKHSSWNVSEIAFVLGFTEVTHFNNFFKKHTKLSPTKFRNV